MNKVVASSAEAVADIPAGSTLMLGGFGLCGIPENLIAALGARRQRPPHHQQQHGRRWLRYGADAGSRHDCLPHRQLRGREQITGATRHRRQIRVELVPQGSLAERIRAGGAGIPAFYTPAGFGTWSPRKKKSRDFDGKRYVMEHGLKADFALIKAWKGDRTAIWSTAKRPQLQPHDGDRCPHHDRRS